VRQRGDCFEDNPVELLGFFKKDELFPEARPRRKKRSVELCFMGKAFHEPRTQQKQGRGTTTWSFFQVETRQMDSFCGHLIKYNAKGTG